MSSFLKEALQLLEKAEKLASGFYLVSKDDKSVISGPVKSARRAYDERKEYKDKENVLVVNHHYQEVNRNGEPHEEPEEMVAESSNPSEDIESLNAFKLQDQLARRALRQALKKVKNKTGDDFVNSLKKECAIELRELIRGIRKELDIEIDELVDELKTKQETTTTMAEGIMVESKVVEYIYDNFYIYSESGTNETGSITIEEHLRKFKVKIKIQYRDGKVYDIHALDFANEREVKRRVSELKKILDTLGR